MTGRAVALLLLACAVGCASTDPAPVTPPHHTWALPDTGAPIAGETALTRRVTEAGLAFELPDSNWQIDEHRVIAGAEAALYRYRWPGHHSTIAFMVEHVGPNDGSARDFAALKQKQLPPQHVDGDLASGTLELQHAVGYRADRVERGVAHTLYVVYALHGEIAVVVVMDAPSAAFAAAEPAFRAALHSLRYYR